MEGDEEDSGQIVTDGRLVAFVAKKRTVLWVFQREVERQCRNALIAVRDLEAAVLPTGPDGRPNDQDRAWYSLHAFLSAAANVSKLLWPISDKKRKGKDGTKPIIPNRGRKLRVTLSVPDSSPLAGRSLRDDFEHFDERLEMWAVTSERHGFADEIIGPSTLIQGMDVQDMQRFYDPETRVAFFRGNEYELEPMIRAIWKLWEATARAMRLPEFRGAPPRPPWL